MTRYFKCAKPKTHVSLSEAYNICAGNRYCSNAVNKVMCCVHRENRNLNLRWPVCDKHAQSFYFKHMGVPVHFEDIVDADIEKHWVEVRPKSAP